MLNKSPIFINAFARGGSNILWNIFQSHPDVCSPIYETDELFGRGNIELRYKMNKLILSILTRQKRFFDFNYLNERKKISSLSAKFIDYILYKEKLKNISNRYNKFKHKNKKYTLEEIKTTRVVAKNLNGLVFISEILVEHYSDATYIALIRDGLALLESFKRRGKVSSAKEFGLFYKKVVKKMISDSKTIPNYYIIKFESLIKDPLVTIKDIFKKTNLNINKIKKYRIKVKDHYDKSGKRTSKLEIGEKIWLSPAELKKYLNPDVNRFQKSKLPKKDIREFLKESYSVMKYFSYI